MRGFAKGLTLCLLLLSLLVTTVSAAAFEDCSGECTHQAAVGTTHYDTLQEAVEAANAGATVTLLTDLDTEALVFTKSLALNLGGKTLTGAPDQALVTFTAGGVVKNGKISVTSGSALNIDGCTVAIEKDAKLEGCGSAPVVLITAGKNRTAKANISGEISGKDTAELIQVVSQEGTCEVNILKNAKLTAEKNLILSMDSAGKLNVAEGILRSQKDMFRVSVAEKRKLEIGDEIKCGRRILIFR